MSNQCWHVFIVVFRSVQTTQTIHQTRVLLSVTALHVFCQPNRGKTAWGPSGSGRSFPAALRQPLVQRNLLVDEHLHYLRPQTTYWPQGHRQITYCNESSHKLYQAPPGLRRPEGQFSDCLTVVSRLCDHAPVWKGNKTSTAHMKHQLCQCMLKSIINKYFMTLLCPSPCTVATENKKAPVHRAEFTFTCHTYTQLLPDLLSDEIT